MRFSYITKQKPMKNKIFKIVASLGLSFAILTAGNAYAELPEYRKVSGIAGKVSSVGSDTLANLMTLWAEEFRKLYPSVNVQIQAAGSSTAPPALISGSSSFGPMSRAMKDKEIADFEKSFGYKPTGFPVAIDALAVFVHKDNPIKGLSLPQVDSVFSSTRKCGESRSAEVWGDLGFGRQLAGSSPPALRQKLCIRYLWLLQRQCFVQGRL